MNQSHKKPILVTGAIRSGTTWVGRMLGLSPSIAVIYEPFNPIHRRGILDATFDGQFTCLTEENGDAIVDSLISTLSFRYNTLAQLKSIRSLRNCLGMVRDYSQFFYWRYFSHPRPLVKDPTAVFSAEWLAKRFGMDVIVLIRHPAAFGYSYKRMNEPNRFADLFRQKVLIDGLLRPFKNEIKEFANGEHDIIDEAILMWRIFYHVVDYYRQRFPEWVFVKHEDLSLNPIDEYRKVFSRMRIDFTPEVEKKIRSYTAPTNPVAARDAVRHQLRRDSRKNVKVWTSRLSASEIRRIRLGTADIWKRYYSDESWLPE